MAVPHLTLSCMIVHGNTSFLQRSEGRDFVLEKDGDSGHGKAKTSQYSSHLEEEKQAGGFFNFAPSSRSFHIWKAAGKLPNNPWQNVKYPHWNDRITKELIAEGWVQVYQEFTRDVD